MIFYPTMEERTEREKIILGRINEVLDQHDYIFRNREDFCENRTDWDALADIAEAFYYRLLDIKYLLKQNG